MPAVTLDALPDPQFEVVFKGQPRLFPPMETLSALHKAMGEKPDAEATVKAVREVTKIEGLSVNQCMMFVNALTEFVMNLPEVKKAQDLTQRFSTSTVDSRPKA